jgi:hypothetical protein
MPLMLASPAIPPGAEIPAAPISRRHCRGRMCRREPGASSLSSRTSTHLPALGGIRHSARLPRSRRGLHGQPDDHGVARSAERLRQNRLRRPLSAQRRRYASLSLPSPGYQPPDTGSEGPCRGARRAEGGAALRYPANRACRRLSPLNRTFSPASARAPNISRRRCRGGRPAPVGEQQPGVVRIGLIDLFVLEKNRPDSRSRCNQNAMRPDSHRVRRHVPWTRFSGFTDAHSIRMWQFLGCLLRMPFRAARPRGSPTVRAFISSPPRKRGPELAPGLNRGQPLEPWRLLDFWLSQE